MKRMTTTYEEEEYERMRDVIRVHTYISAKAFWTQERQFHPPLVARLW